MLKNPILAEILSEDDRGGWSICDETINRLELEIQQRCPDTVLEFGSGLSTVCLSCFMKELHADSVPRVFSVEQDSVFIAYVQDRLVRIGMDNVKLLHAPLVEREFWGEWVHCYDLRENDLELIAQACPSLVLIDGPVCDTWGDRVAVLPMIKDCIAKDCSIFIDDSKREAELGVLKSWEKFTGLHVRELLETDKGVAIACLN